MSITTSSFGTLGTRQITAFTLENENNLKVRILDYGGIITELHAPGYNGTADVVLGFDTLEDYLHNPAYIGAIVGRYANRIKGGRFTLDSVEHKIDTNEGSNHLHGGFNGFNSQIWHADAYTDNNASCLRLTRRSVDGEGGFPGNLDVEVIYRLDEKDSLIVEYGAIADAPTPVSLTQHSYFNLCGHDSGDIRRHHLQIFSSHITESDEQLLPTGQLVDIAGTAYDFRESVPLRPDHPQLENGYDVNYIINASPGILRPAAILIEPVSGRRMSVSTTKPGIQLYDGTYLPTIEATGKNGVRYPKWAGLCLETQHFPDSVNQPGFPSSIIRPGERYSHVTVYKFDVL